MGFDMTHLYGKSTLDLGGASGKRSEIMKKEEYGWARMKSGCSVSCGGGNRFSEYLALHLRHYLN